MRDFPVLMGFRHSSPRTSGSILGSRGSYIEGPKVRESVANNLATHFGVCSNRPSMDNESWRKLGINPTGRIKREK